MRKRSESGQSLIELLFAMTLFIIGVITIAYMMFGSQITLARSTDTLQARFLAQECLEIARTLRDESFDALTTGTHAFALQGDSWTLVASPETIEKFTRTIEITDTDEDTKEVSCSVSWIGQGDLLSSFALGSIITNWKQTKGDAKDIVVNIGGAVLAEGDTELQGLTLENATSSERTVTHLALQWEGTTTLQRIAMDGTDVFQNASGSPGMASGDTINIIDVTITGNSTSTIDALEFNGSVLGSPFLLTAVLSDGSKRYARISL